MGSKAAAVSITPVILTFNEELNLRRTLESMCWAQQIVILDSGSTDSTERIARSFDNVEWNVRTFDTHAQQWSHAIFDTGIASTYVLALDADMLTPVKLIDELASHFLPGNFAGAMVPLQHWVLGHSLPGTLLKPQLRLFRKADVRITQTGHTQRFEIDGPVYHCSQAILHDDRKTLENWVRAQLKYSDLEKVRLLSLTRPSARDSLRRGRLMPLVSATLAYVLGGGPFNHKVSVYYALERLVYESFLAMRLLREELVDEENHEGK